MPMFIPIGLAAGVASALLFASAAYGSMGGRLLLFFLAPLPCFLAGLGWGAASAALAAVSSAIGAMALLGLKAGAVLLLSQGIPVVVLCHLSQLRREVDVGAPQPVVEWYPLGRIVAVAAVLAGLISCVSILMLGADLDQLRAMLKEIVEKVFVKQLPGLQDRQLGEKEIAALVELTLHVLPGASALSWLGGFLLNLYLAGRVTLASGRLERPWPDVASVGLPGWVGLGLALALVASFVSGYPGLIASGFAGAFLCAYMLIGLAIVHYSTRGKPGRPMMLWGLYIGLFILNTWAAIALAMVALLEPFHRWRQKAAARNVPPPGST